MSQKSWGLILHGSRNCVKGELENDWTGTASSQSSPLEGVPSPGPVRASLSPSGCHQAVWLLAGLFIYLSQCNGVRRELA